MYSAWNDDRVHIKGNDAGFFREECAEVLSRAMSQTSALGCLTTQEEEYFRKMNVLIISLISIEQLGMSDGS